MMKENKDYVVIVNPETLRPIKIYNLSGSRLLSLHKIKNYIQNTHTGDGIPDENMRVLIECIGKKSYTEEDRIVINKVREWYLKETHK